MSLSPNLFSISGAGDDSGNFHTKPRRSKVEIGAGFISSTERRKPTALNSHKAQRDFVPRPNISILLFYTHEQFPLQRTAKSEEKICCYLLTLSYLRKLPQNWETLYLDYDPLL